MADVVLFDHIPKTGGMTARYVLWRAIGKHRVLTSHSFKGHRRRLGGIASQLDLPLEGQYVVQTHIGTGIGPYLPARHRYRGLTFLRDPMERTISHYFYGRDRPEWDIPPGLSLLEFLRENTLMSFNVQTAFLGGLWARHFLEEEPIGRDQFDQSLLDRAKDNLERYAVVGLTERFDETLLLLRNELGWPAWRTAYRSVNRGTVRRTTRSPTTKELAATRANNELDLELYAFARETFASRLDRVSAYRPRLWGFKAFNGACQHLYTYSRGQRLLRTVNGSRSVEGALPVSDPVRRSA